MRRPIVLLIVVLLSAALAACAPGGGSSGAPPPAPSRGVSLDRAEPSIAASVYSYLYAAGSEQPDYGLYSYVLFPSYSRRAETFLANLFKTTGAVDASGIDPQHLNIIYIPTRSEKRALLLPQIADGRPPPVTPFASEFYDFAQARRLLAQICTAPSDAIRYVCRTDLSRGPYLFTFSRPASNLARVPPPYLFVDLSSVHERAFAEFVTAYKEQVKRADYSDAERIDNLRLTVLNVILTAADWIGPVKGAIADTVYMAEAGR
jgi:hypothetical protein